MFSLDFHEVSLTHEWYIKLYSLKIQWNHLAYRNTSCYSGCIIVRSCNVGWLRRWSFIQTKDMILGFMWWNSTTKKKNYWSKSLQMPFNGSIVNVIHDQIPKLTLNFCDLDSWQQQKEMKW